MNPPTYCLKRRLPGGLFVMACVLTLTACQTMTDLSAPIPQASQTAVGQAPIEMTSCALFGPISWVDDDTAQTKTEVKEHNAVYKRVCQK